MALTTRAPGQSPIDSSAINQFVQALTGSMSDQAFTLNNSLTVSGVTTLNSTLSVTGVLTSSQINSSGGITAATVILGSSNITASSGFMASRNGSSTPSGAAIKVFGMGSSGPGFYWGSSVPTIAGVQGSLMINTGGSSTATLYVAAPNAGTASSSNWAPVTLS